MTQQGEKITAEDEFYIKWADESLKDNLSLINDIIRQLLTISAALLGISIFYDKILNDELLKLFVIFLFLIAFTLTFFGVLPFSGTVDLANIDAFKKHKRNAFKYKYWITVCAGLCLISGLSCILVTLFLNYLHK